MRACGRAGRRAGKAESRCPSTDGHLYRFMLQLIAMHVRRVLCPRPPDWPTHGGTSRMQEPPPASGMAALARFTR